MTTSKEVKNKEVLHTQEEWTIEPHLYGLHEEAKHHVCIVSSGNWIADCGPYDNGDSKPKAELICKAVNERQRLIDSNRETVELLQRVVKELEKYGTIGRDMLPEFNDLINNAKNLQP